MSRSFSLVRATSVVAHNTGRDAQQQQQQQTNIKFPQFFFYGYCCIIVCNAHACAAQQHIIIMYEYEYSHHITSHHMIPHIHGQSTYPTPMYEYNNVSREYIRIAACYPRRRTSIAWKLFGAPKGQGHHGTPPPPHLPPSLPQKTKQHKTCTQHTRTRNQPNHATASRTATRNNQPTPTHMIPAHDHVKPFLQSRRMPTSRSSHTKTTRALFSLTPTRTRTRTRDWGEGGGRGCSHNERITCCFSSK